MTSRDEITAEARASDANAPSSASQSRSPAAPSPAAASLDAPSSRRTRFNAVSYRLLSRTAFWSPVLVALVLFAQVSFRGLRPAMAEARRLASAEVSLDERHDRAVAENRETAAHLAARQDPIFRERQRRLRVIEPPTSPPIAKDSARTDDGS